MLQLQKQQQFVVLDVGGGSTEISIFEHGQKVAARSFELGTIRILKGKIKADIWTDFEAWIRKNVRLDEAHVVFGTGGNINRALKMSDTSTNDTLQLAVLQKLHAALLPLSIEERCNQFKLKPDRADVIVPALQIYITALEVLGQDRLVVPKIGLSDGVIYQLFLENTPV